MLVNPHTRVYWKLVNIISALALLALFSSIAWPQSNTGADVPRLIQGLQSRDPQVRGKAADDLRDIGPDAKLAIPYLVNALQDPVDRVRWKAAGALGKIGSQAKDAVPALKQALKDKSPGVRRMSTEALGDIGQDAQPAIPELVLAAKMEEVNVRAAALRALGKIGQNPETVVPVLIATLKDDALKVKDTNVRWSAADALAHFPEDLRSNVSLVGEMLNDPSLDNRLKAASILGSLGKDARAAVAGLIQTAGNTKEDKEVRKTSIQALAQFVREVNEDASTQEAQREVEQILQSLIAVVKNKSEGKEVRAEAMTAIASTGPKAKVALEPLIETLENPADQALVSTISAIAHSLAASRDKEALSLLQKARKAIEDAGGDASEISRAIDVLDRGVGYWVRRNWKWLLIPGYLLVVTFVFLLRPLWILRLSYWFDHVKLPEQYGGNIVSARYIFLVGFFQYSCRVLNKWTEKYISVARTRFFEKPTAKERQLYVPVPVVCDRTTIASPTAGDFRGTFAGNRARVLVSGEGGLGKTSFVCQLAKWAMLEDKAARLCPKYFMLPVLIEKNIEADGQNTKAPFLNAVRGGLMELIDEKEPIHEKLVERLLRKKRILVIVDGLSELSEETADSINPANTDFPANALLVTSRNELELDGAIKTNIKPLRVEAGKLTSFMEAYLTQRGKKGLFSDDEFTGACKTLSAMVEGRNITVLLAKLYAEQMISIKERESEVSMPENVPDLILSYVNELNRSRKEGEPDDREVHKAAKLIARECLKDSFQVKQAKRDDIVKALGTEGIDEAILEYLEEQLLLIQTVNPGKEHIRFALDPLAEYLAGLNVVEEFGGSRWRWQQFLDKADAIPGAPKTVKSFLVAVLDCSAASKDHQVPEFVIDALRERTALK